jgi:hypothetical protein
MDNLNTGIDPLEPESLPSDPREMAFRLLGMATSELREIDKNVVSGHGSIGGVRADINKIVADVNNNLSKPIQKPEVTALPTVTQIIPSNQPNLFTENALPQSNIENDNEHQLELDFFRKIKPEDIEYELRCINKAINDLDTKLEYVLSLIKKNL